MTTAATRRAYGGPTLFSFGFRPFFLFGACWAALAVPLWVHSFLLGGTHAVSRDWHVHEMLFGFLAAIVAGFLTTAVPNWTGRMPVIGAPLAGLVGLWIAGRLAMLYESILGPIAAVVDCAFLVVFALVIWREVLAGRNWRNLPVCGLVSVLALGNVAFHLNGVLWSTGLGERMALGAIMVLLSLIGGRVTPSFTRNWMRANGVAEPKPASGRLDQVGLGAAAAASAAWILFPETPATGALLVVAGAANLARLSRWCGWRTLRAPLVWILHLGFAWLGAAQIMLGAAVLTSAVPRTAGIHALTAGAVGVMTLAMMTRATRGHTGRPLAADSWTTALFVLVNAAAVVRVTAPFLDGARIGLLIASACLWALAFGGFAVLYGRMLTTPRPAVTARA
ncbi:MAG TPA: NnrS family protein [Phenylobacterium sp.]|nr:NnrS family protein [Phenylobacterium sp.]